MNNASQTCQDESTPRKTLSAEVKKNKKLNSTENLYKCEKETNVLNESLIASQKGMKVRK